MSPLKISVSILTVLVAVIYLISCLTPYIGPVHFWPLTFLALAFPITFLILLILIFGWWPYNYRLVLLLTVLALTGYKNITQVFAVNIPKNFQYNKTGNTLRILSWNVKGFGNNAKHAESPGATRRQMINFIKKADADILLLQEYSDYQNSAMYSNTKYLSDTLGYKYSYTSNDINWQVSYGPVKMGSAIFSKIPLTDTGKLCYAHISRRECAIKADVIFKNKKISLFTTHLVSLNLLSGYISNPDHTQPRSEIDFINRSSMFEKIKEYDKVHAEQAKELKQFINGTNHAVIVTGDFNAVPTSYASHIIKGNLQDAFIQKGFGLGRTYAKLSPTLRIDYILADRRLNILQYNCPPLQLSDHYPLITDVEWQ